MAFCPNGAWLAAACGDGEVTIYDVEAATRASALAGHASSAEQVAYDPASANGDRALTVSTDKTAKFWDVKSGKCASTIELKEAGYACAWSPSGRHCSVGTAEAVKIIDATTMNVVWEQKFEYEVNAMTWDVSGKKFMLATGQGKMEKFSFDDSTGALTHASSHFAHNGGCYCIEMDPTGKYFAMGAADAIVSLWATEELMCYDTVVRLDWPIRALAYSHDSAYIASASEDMFIDIADVKTGSCMAQIKTEVATNAVAFHPKELVLAYGGDDPKGTVRLWSVTKSFTMGSK